ncbi:MAG TPA: dienelactone hydrolase family protein [Alphaproteobacteria bacterium]|nr:dienelactone hydrolase family protein [Alphaproteobacteria bacterium]
MSTVGDARDPRHCGTSPIWYYFSMAQLRRLLLIAALLAAAVAARAETTQVRIGANHNMLATVIAPDGPGPYPAVLVLHTSRNLGHYEFEYAQRLVDAGYVTLLPAFMDAYKISSGARYASFSTYRDRIYADLADGVDWLRTTPKVAGQKVGAVGFSNGGYWAVTLAATGKVAAGVTYYGVLSGMEGGIRDHFKEVITSKSSPILILHGEEDRDQKVQGARFLNRLLTRRGVPHETHIYPGTHHDFDRSGENPAAADDAWQRTVAFFAMHLKHP